ncbi:MAG: hypothetical protein QM572_13910 [Nocardioides sp.]
MSSLAQARAALRPHVLPGAYRLHFKSERNDRRGAILDTILSLPITVRLYIGPRAEQVQTRTGALTSLAEESARGDVERIVIERDDSVVAVDRRTIAVAMRGSTHLLEYAHLRAKEEPLLWASDAVAWCWQRGGRWRQRAQPVIADVRRV